MQNLLLTSLILHLSGESHTKADISTLEQLSALWQLVTLQAFLKPALSHIGRVTGLSPAKIGNTDPGQVLVTDLID